MKRILSLFAFLFSLVLGLSAQTPMPQWTQDLVNLNPGVIDSIHRIAAHPDGPDTRTYIIYYNQPLEHAKPDGPHFHLRATMTVFNDADPTTAINHVYCGGYAISTDLPDSIFALGKKYCAMEIAHRYHANYISIEYRYFQYSSPDACWTNLDPLRSDEAAADFHHFFDALKKVLKGKWVMSGVSKGGITTLLQHHFYPNDMDVYVPYSAPFFDSDRDLEMQKYWYNNGWNKYYRDIFSAVRENGIDRFSTIYPIYDKMNTGNNTAKEHTDSVLVGYLYGIADFGFTEHAEQDTATIRAQMYVNDSIMQSLGLQYGDTVYAYMIEKGKFALDSLQRWIDTLRKYPEPKQMPQRNLTLRRHRPFGVSEYDWWYGKPEQRTNEAAYEYLSKCELGFYDIRFDLMTSDAATAKLFNDTVAKIAGCFRDYSAPCYASRTFSRTLYDQTMTSTQAATKPIILIYGEDDTWTGAAVKDRFINGTNVQKFILPGQNHAVAFSSDTDKTKCDAIRAILDQVLGTPQWMEEITNHQSPMTNAVKVLQNGQIIIIRNNEKYDITGKKL